MERTFLMIKPDGIKRGLAGRILSRFEDKGFALVACKFVHLTEDQARSHYEEHANKPFFQSLVQFITSAPVLAMVWEGQQIITLSRQLIGKTNVVEALPGTIRGDFACETSYNLIHGSDCVANANREITNVFTKDELLLASDRSIGDETIH